jgi:aminoglycoside phosphotransferase (APT) family kinase protein
MHGERDLAANPQVAADEHRLLRHLYAAGLPVPKPVLLDDSCSLADRPYLVVGYIEGEPVFDPADGPGYVRQMAKALHAVHCVDPHPVGFLPAASERARQLVDELLGTGDGTAPEAQLHPQLTAARSALTQQPSRPALLHGDFWPGNVLWQNGSIAGIIDWEDAAIGDPVSDLANARLELWWTLGREGCEGFTREYAGMAGASVDLTPLPAWDLLVGLRAAARLEGWGLPADKEGEMRAGLRAFLDCAARRLARGVSEASV